MKTLRSVRCITLATLVLAPACVHRVPLTSAAAVSMKHRNVPAGKTLAKKGDVSARYCAEQFKASSGRTLGLMDEVIKVAEKENKIDFVRNAQFYREGDCVILEGEGAVIQ